MNEPKKDNYLLFVSEKSSTFALSIKRKTDSHEKNVSTVEEKEKKQTWFQK
jgi:hypothetical protein